MNASKLGQQIRWVMQYNAANERAFRHWLSVGPKGSVLTNIVNVRAFKRHFRKACRIQARRDLTLIRFDDLPPANVPHSEPDYDNAIPQDWLDKADAAYERMNQSNK